MDSLPVVVVNGLGAPHALAAGYAFGLRRRGLQAFAVTPTLLGFGDIRAAARRVQGFVADVRARTGAERVWLVGMSLGGLIGLYYLKCLDGGRDVECFVSVGGPLNGSRLACAIRLLPGAPPVFRQLCRFGEMEEELRATPGPVGVRMFTVGTRGDVVTPRSIWQAEGLECVETPYGVFPLGHWCLFVVPANQRVVVELLRRARG